MPTEFIVVGKLGMYNKLEHSPVPKDTLIGRGKCCGLGCVNCPYEPKHTNGSTNLSEFGKSK